MNYPADMTAEDIMQFEYEYNRLLDIEHGEGFWAVNDLLQVIANEQNCQPVIDLSREG